LPNPTAYKLLEACRGPGCPVCRLEQQSVARYLDNHFYESVNSPAWRDRLRASHGFCHEHAWLGVNRRLGDALGFSIIYHDIVNTILDQLNEDRSPARSPRGWATLLGQVPEKARASIQKMLYAFSPRKGCPVCEHRDEVRRTLLSILVEEMGAREMAEALQTSDGLCLPHLRLALGYVREDSICDQLLTIHRDKLARLRTELAEFIRKNDYQAFQEGFGAEGDAWLRAIGMIAGSRKEP